MKPEPHEEAVARRLMASVLGVAVERHDDNSADAMFDFMFTLPDGRCGAAEMTAITDPLAREWAALANRPLIVPGSSWAWMVRRQGDRVSRHQLRRHLPRLATLAEQAGEPDVRRLLRDRAHAHDQSMQWLAASKVQIRGLRGSSHPGKVYLEPDTAGSFVVDQLDPALEWIEQKLREPAFDGKFAKLVSSGLPEQHLVLRLDVGAAIPSEHWFALTEHETALPSRAPAVEGRHLTGLWLLPDFGTSIVLWTANGGWCRHLIGTTG